MDVEKAFKAIDEWFDGESYQIQELTQQCGGTKKDFEQHKDFLGVYGHQVIGYCGDDFSGNIWFEYSRGKYIKTYFEC